MRRPIVAVTVAILILSAAAASLVLAACGSSTSDTVSQAGSVGAPQGGGPPGDMSAMLTQQLDPLVKAGTLKSDQAKAVVSAIQKSMSAQGPQGGARPSPGATPRPDMTPGSARPDPSSMFTGTLDSLVKDGTITAKQEKAIVAALGSGMRGAAPPGGMQAQSGSGTSQTY